MYVELAGLRLRNPIVLAAGTCGYIDELADVVDLHAIGAVVTKSITRQERQGNPPWRIIDLPRAPGMLNAIGLANIGLDRFLAEKLPAAAKAPAVVIGSVAGHSIDEYVAVAGAFDQSGLLPAIELNVSCPNTADGLQFGEHPRKLQELLRAVRPVVRRAKLFVKLSPNVGDIVGMARAAVDCGIDGLTLINTVSAMSIDVESRRPRLGSPPARGTGVGGLSGAGAGAAAGGLSGPAIHPIAVRMVHDVYRGVAREAGVPVIGIGGVLRWEDAAELILAGAAAVGMGTALFVDPRLPVNVAAGLERWVARQGCAGIAELIGALR
jgi:dihydroorotate dehydrogenase (NAD+) catalytic subunit